MCKKNKKSWKISDVFRFLRCGFLLLVGVSFAVVELKATDCIIKQSEEWIVHGKVLDADSLPLPGVSVMVKGLKMGTVTNVSGLFELELTGNEEWILVFSFIGMESQEVAVSKKRREIEVVMKPHFEELDEVVKVGYYSTTKRRASGSVAVLTQKDLQYRIPTSIDDLFQGMVAGVASSRGIGGIKN